MFNTSISGSPARSPSPRALPLAAVVAALVMGGICPPTALARQAPLSAAATTVAAAATVKAPEETTVPADDERSRLVYSVNRTPERPFDTARAVQVITAEDIWRKNARTVPELLMNETGLFVQQTNYGGGSPVIRGLMGKQVVILLDGVRINNATFRFGPDGLPARITAERYRDVDGKGVLTPWGGGASDFREVGGLKLPFRMQAFWIVDGREVQYVDFEVESVEYDRPEPY